MTPPQPEGRSQTMEAPAPVAVTDSPHSTTRSRIGWDAPTGVRATIAAGSIFLLLVGANIITPLFPVFSQRLHLSSTDTTLAFVAYLVPLVVGLPIVGHWSDIAGRRLIMACAVVIALVATLCFLNATSLAWLIVGRSMHGVAVALATGTAAASLRDLLGRSRPELATRITLLSTAGGVACGPVIGGFLSRFGDPVTTPYAVHFVSTASMLLLLMLLKPLPPVTPKDPAASWWPHLIPQLPHVPRSTRRIFALAASTGFLSFALFGYTLAIAPGRYGEILGHTPLMAGLLATIALGTSAAMQLAPIRGAHKAAVALTVMALALATMLYADRTHAGGILIAAVFAAGASQGVAFRTLFATLSALTPPREVARCVSLLYVVTYLGSALPVLALGIAMDHFNRNTAVSTFFIVLVAMASALAVGCFCYRVPRSEQFAHHGH